MNSFLELELNTDESKLTNLSIESLDGMMFRELMDDDSISLEGDLFGIIKDISGKIATFFKNIFSYIKDMLNLRKRLDSLLETNTHLEVKKCLKKADRILPQVTYVDISEIEIPTPLGFNTKLLPILNNITSNGKDFLKKYTDMMTEFDTELSDFLSMEDKRRTFTITNNDKKNKKYIDGFDKDMMELFNRKQKGSSSSIDNVFGNRDSIKLALEKANQCFEIIPEKEYRIAIASLDSMVIKIEALYELVEVEDEPVSKPALKAVINAITIAANFNTVLGKIGLTIYESSRLSINTVNLLEKIDK